MGICPFKELRLAIQVTLRDLYWIAVVVAKESLRFLSPGLTSANSFIFLAEEIKGWFTQGHTAEWKPGLRLKPDALSTVLYNHQASSLVGFGGQDS